MPSQRRPTPHEGLPDFVAPMLLGTASQSPEASDVWAVEVKFDGIRAQFRAGGARGWRVRSRPGRDCTAQFPELAQLADVFQDRRLIFDGELVHFGADGRPDFGGLRSRLSARDAAAAARASARHPATLVIFDVLHLNGRAVRVLPYHERRQLLAELVPPNGPTWRIAPSWTQRLDDVVGVTREHQLEGVVFKRLDSPYRAGRRSDAWRKYKHRRRETLAVAAWTPGDRQPDTFYLTRIGVDGQPAFAGAVQLGLSGETREGLRRAVLERELSAPRRRRIRPIRAGVSLVVSAHGTAGGPLRDPIIREFVLHD